MVQPISLSDDKVSTGSLVIDPCMDALLEPTQRSAVAALAAALANRKCEDEDGQGLYDDFGALLRYLRARNWDPDRAEAMIRSTARWRKEFGDSAVISGGRQEEVARENALGNVYVRGFDRSGRPAIYLKPGGAGWGGTSGVYHLVYCIERAIACVECQAERGNLVLQADDPTSRKFVLLADFSGVGLGTPMGVVRQYIQIMQDHYPERLGQAFFVNAPFLMWGFFSAASSFADPATVKKLQFISEESSARRQRMSEFFDLAVLEPGFGGTAKEQFESAIFLTTKINDSLPVA